MVLGGRGDRALLDLRSPGARWSLHFCVAFIVHRCVNVPLLRWRDRGLLFSLRGEACTFFRISYTLLHQLFNAQVAESELTVGGQPALYCVAVPLHILLVPSLLTLSVTLVDHMVRKSSSMMNLMLITLLSFATPFRAHPSHAW